MGVWWSQMAVCGATEESRMESEASLHCNPNTLVCINYQKSMIYPKSMITSKYKKIR